jgi:hypothetical protein
MTERDLPPEDLRDLDRSLGSVRFEPRASLLPEVLGRLRGGERSKGAAPSPSRRHLLRWGAVAAIALIAAVSTLVTRWAPGRVTVDRCCFDFDGGGAVDDGVLVVSLGGREVRRVAVYEDRDGSRSFTPADVIRFDRGATPALAALPGSGLITARFCCSDYDGEGPSDDGLLVVGAPPDRVTMVALYEHRPDQPSQFPLR